MKNSWFWMVFLRIVLLIFIGAAVILFLTREAHGSSFDHLPNLGYAPSRDRPTQEDLRRARELLRRERAPRNGCVLALLTGDEILAVPVDASGASRLPGVAIRKVRGNGVNSHFEVLFPENGIVLALRRNVRGTGVVYVPWSHGMDTLVLRTEGLDYLRSLLTMAEARTRAVPSLASRGKSVVEVVPRDIVLGLIFVEHIDGSRWERGESLIPFLQRTLVIFGANKGDAYRYSRSFAGARGISQMMPATYLATRRAYPRARLPMSFLAAMADHEDSVAAMYCVIDSIIARLPPWARRGLLASGNELNLGLYVAAAYNAGTSNAQRMFNRYAFARRYAPERAERAYLGKFEAVWNLR
ncbi:hypothetical protein HYT45_01845 [Candidatus Uhrbacteria bacterium]|nr:hypothetical protein [Candidatus Uhrbacteria bacterium]